MDKKLIKKRIKDLKEFLNSNQPDFDVSFPKAIKEIDKLEKQLKSKMR